MPPIGNQNVPVFLGSHNLYPKGVVSMSWSVNGTDSAINNTLQVPGVAANEATGGAVWNKFIVDPVANQGSFTFGNGVSMQLQITRNTSFYVSADSYSVVGRVVIFIPSTGQLFVFAPKRVYGFAAENVEGENNFLETVNGVVPIFLAEGTQMEVWLEPDQNDGDIVLPSSVVGLTLFNTEVAPVGVN